MSRINDALKLAQEKNSAPNAALPPLPPATSSLPTNWFLPLTVGALVAIACFFIGLSFAKRPSEPTPAVQRTVTASARQQTSIEPPAPASSVAAAAPAVTNVVSKPVATIAPLPVARPVLPRLQGIAYNSGRPWAIIDGKTVYTGDSIGNFRVTKMTPNSVVLAGNDGTNTLSLNP